MSKNALEIANTKIQAIQKHIDLINTFFRNNMPLMALKEMIYLISELDPQDKPTELREKIIREINALERFVRGSGKYNERLKKHKWIYKNWSDDLQGHIWDKGYNNADKYLGMSYPSNYKSREPYKSPLL